MIILRNLGKKINKLIERNQFILYLVMFFAVFLVYLWINSTPSFLDPDSFYHLKMSQLISQKGLIMDLPWQQFSLLKDNFVDHHLLYHIAAIPFIKVMGNFAGFKFYTVILASLFVFLSYYFFKKWQIKYPEIFTLLLLLSPAFMFRISLAKATAFSLIILFAGIYCIFQRRLWWLFFLSWLYVWSYGGFFMLLGMAIIYVFCQAVWEAFIKQGLVDHLKVQLGILTWKNRCATFISQLLSRSNIKLIIASGLGLITGLVVNPYFPKNLLFYWQQIVQIGIINYGQKVNVGGEWYPFKLVDLLSNSGVVFIAGTVSIIIFIFLMKKQSVFSLFFCVASLIFFALTLKSQRYVEYFIPFLAYFVAFSLTDALKNSDLKKFFHDLTAGSKFMSWVVRGTFILILVFPLIMIKDLYITRESFKGGLGFDKFQGVSLFLKEHSQPGEIVMHTDWSDWPMLFYHNDYNYYIMGLDPTFMYNYNQELYQLFADITMAKKSDNLYSNIKDKFQASYFIVNENRPQLARNLELDGHFEKVYQDKDSAIYKLQ